jgi:DnaJ family protein C protein 3
LTVSRAECAIQRNELDQAVGDYSRVLKYQGNNSELTLKLATLYAKLGEISSSINTTKECLHNDPEHRGCKKMFKEMKKLQKQLNLLTELEEKRKLKRVKELLFVDEKLAERVEELGSDVLKKTVYLAACKAYGMVLLANTDKGT